MEFQTRTHDGELRYYQTLEEALQYAEKNVLVWKISFSVGEDRVRLVKSPIGWVYEDIDGNKRCNLRTV